MPKTNLLWTLKTIKMIAFGAATIGVNATASSLSINDRITGELSDYIPNLFIPTGVTFSFFAMLFKTLAEEAPTGRAIVVTPVIVPAVVGGGLRLRIAGWLRG
jgi:hypothetical protein